MTTEQLSGSRVHFGPRTSDKDLQSTVYDGLEKVMVIPLRTVAGNTSLILPQNVGDESDWVIPAGSYIHYAAINVGTAFAATTAVSITAGLTGAADGLITALGVGDIANLTAGNWDAGDGALIEGPVGAVDVRPIAAWDVGDVTAVGEAVMVIKYIEQLTSRYL